MSKKLHLNFGGYSDAGVKALNQDAFTARIPSDHAGRKYKGAVACIADGASCSDNAQIASQTAATNFISDYFSTPDFWTVKQSASKVISAINSWLHQQSLQSHTRSDGYVTTFSALIVKSNTAHILHVGDSRVYLVRDKQIELITRDHHYKRGNENILARALGIEPQLELDYSSLQVQTGDRFLLSTDGVHGHMSTKELRGLVSSQENTLEEIANEIGRMSLANGSQDNVSCLLVEVESLPIKRLVEVHQNLSTLVIPPVLDPGNKIDHFEIIRSLHSGTRSHVYLAKDLNSEALRVLKVPSSNFSDNAHYLELFAREQWIGRKLNYSGIMKIYSPPAGSKFLYHCCEYLPGATLRQWMIDNPKPDLNEVRGILDAMIRVVRILHRNKMVHRDLKPENFIIDRNGSISLIDFGTMKISGIDELDYSTVDELPLGDLAYIAPETLVNSTSSSVSDLFSIAAIVYEMICGELPFKATNFRSERPKNFEPWKYRSLTRSNQGDQNIPSWVDTILERALHPNPQRRYQTMSEFQHDLSFPSNEILKSIELRPLIERNPIGFWKGLSLVLLAIILVQWWMMQAN